MGRALERALIKYLSSQSERKSTKIETESRNHDLLSLGIVIPFVTVIIYNTTYNYELGSFRNLFIPPEFIQVDIFNSLSFLSPILAASTFVFLFFDLIISALSNCLYKQFNKRPYLILIVFLSFLLGSITLLFSPYVRIGTNLAILVLGSIILLLFKADAGEITGERHGIANLTIAFKISIYAAKRYGKTAGIFLICFGASGIISYCVGFFKDDFFPHRYTTSRITNNGFQTTGNKLLRKYSAYSIYLRDSLTSSEITVLTVVYSPDKADTFIINKNKPHSDACYLKYLPILFPLF